VECVYALLHGNELGQGHHVEGKLSVADDTKDIDIIVPEASEGFPVDIWYDSPDKMSFSVISPNGEVIERIITNQDTTMEVVLQGGSLVKIHYYSLVSGIGSSVGRIEIINPIAGIWKITVHGDTVFNGTYHAWLPITGLVTPGVKFANPTPNYTVVVPSTTMGSITCGAYNSINNVLYDKSSWGPTRIQMGSPDLVAPGVDVTGIYPGNITGTLTGTSVATAITTGACALMLQWGIVNKEDVTLDTYKIRAYLIRGCIKDSNIQYPNNQWGYGKLNLLNTFNELRP
jgi:hypothetical protein